MKRRENSVPVLLLAMLLMCGITPSAPAQSYRIVDTGVHTFYNNIAVITAPSQNEAFYGQDAHYEGRQPTYTDNGDGTVTDDVTGLMWQKDMGPKISFAAAHVKADTMTLGGYQDWRIPTIKELYSLILFTGQVKGESAIKVFIDTTVFIQPLGDASLGEREIDAQTWSSTRYRGLTFQRDSTVFGVNFIDGRIKGYPLYKPGSGTARPNVMYFRMVRGNTAYGVNDFVDNGDGSITDNATGLMWQQSDDGVARDWEHALEYAEQATLAGYTDWRLPDIKELQSIVDYSRCPQATGSAALDPIFNTTSINDPDGRPGHYPFFWSSTTHLDGANPYASAAYVAFGEALGKMNNTVMDVHGAGAQRSDPKAGDAQAYPQFFGPQGDVRYVYNYVRCVRTVGGTSGAADNPVLPERNILEQNFPNPATSATTIPFRLNNSSAISLTVHDLLGRQIATVMEGIAAAGSHSAILRTGKFPAGLYFYRLRSETETLTRCMIIAPQGGN
ncbi:MAG TPA: DUF1566 domain-containing protein [Bacteroidota bacterium]|nr:DUF1566 domain-containing protein [Bacteroidota bacterium]